MNHYNVIIIGAGAAGLFASAMIEDNIPVLILEKNSIAGKKLLITGKGRCNITNNCDVEELLKNTPVNGKFLINAFYSYSTKDIIDFFNKNGLRTKIERGNRVFPVSDKASDVVDTLLKEALNDTKKKILFNKKVIKTYKEKNQFHIITKDNEHFTSEFLLITTGGKSYPTTGSTGDGYSFARSLGHTVTPIKPALIPIEVKETWIRELQGLSLRNVKITLKEDKKILYSDFGEMLFTHYGISGPIILSMSSFFSSIKNKILSIDLKPALSYEKLNERILREINIHPKKQIRFLFKTLLPQKMIPLFIKLLDMDAQKKMSYLTKQERKKIINLLKEFPLHLTKFRDIKEAIITSGGISTKELNPKTMESKLIKNLYFAGEIIDCDSLTGGFNLQIAWSSAYVAAKDISFKIKNRII